MFYVIVVQILCAVLCETYGIYLVQVNILLECENITMQSEFASVKTVFFSEILALIIIFANTNPVSTHKPAETKRTRTKHTS